MGLHGHVRARLAGLLVLAALANGIGGCQRADLGKSAEARVVKVYDGDTIELSDGRVVRYIGIDAPEHGRPGADSATALNRRLVLDRNVRVEYDGELKDHYGRDLAYVYADGSMVNAEIIAAGWAWSYVFPKNMRHAVELLHLQQQAMRAHRGLWSFPAVETADHYVASFQSYRFHRPDCPAAAAIRADDLITFRARDSALYAGYSPCRLCLP